MVFGGGGIYIIYGLSWLVFFTKQCYSMVAISQGGSTKAPHRSLTGPHGEVYYLNFIRAHTPKQYKCHKPEQRHF